MKKNTDKIKQNGISLKYYIIVCATLVMLAAIRYGFFVITKCQGNSMYPTIRNGATLVGIKAFYSIDRNDLIVADPEEINGTVIKRVVGIEGDHIEIKDGKLYINGEIDTQFPNAQYIDETLDVIVPEDSYFLMGDNRDQSEDSRVFGAITDDEIRYKVIYYSKEITSP